AAIGAADGIVQRTGVTIVALHRGAPASLGAIHGKSRTGLARPAFLDYPDFVAQLPPLHIQDDGTRRVTVQCRSHHSSASPTAIAMPPIRRNSCNGACSSCPAMRFHAAGAANRNSPSITATRHRAANRSFIVSS